MKNYKIIMPLFLVLALVGSVVYAISTRMRNNDDYADALHDARVFAEKGIEVDAMEAYSRAIRLKPSLDLSIEIGETYLSFEDYSGASRWYTGNLLANYPKETITYLYGIKMNLARGNENAAFEVYDDYRGRKLFSEDVESAIAPVLYRYDLVGNYEEVGVFSNVTGTAPVMYNGKWGYIKKNLSRAVAFQFAEADYYGTYAPVIDSEGHAYLVDQEGNVKVNERLIIDQDPDFGTVVRFGVHFNGVILAYNGTIWNYYNDETYKKLFGGYAEATPIISDVGAVSKDGKTFALINAEGNLTTDFIFDEVLKDEKQVVCRNQTIFVRQGDAYYMVDTNGKKISNTAYDDARAFGDTSFAAVLKDGKWLFVDNQGKVALSGDYEDAQSFSNGFAAVKKDGKWGYINEKGDLVIPCIFEDARAFASSGVAFVKDEYNSWRLLKLYYYNH